MASSQLPVRSAQSSYGSTEARLDTSRDGGFDDLSRQISNKVFKINSNASALERQARKIGSKDDKPELREKLHDIQHETNEIASNLPAIIKRLQDSVNRSDRQRRLQVERLKTSFRSAVERYGTIQKKVTDQVKSETLLSGQRAQSYDQQEPDTWSDEAALIDVDQQRKQMQVRQIEAEDELAMARDREERIRTIEGDVLDINEIFKELGAMVVEQGEMVDDIEANVVRAADHVEEGNVQLDKAVSYQKKYRKKLCIIALIALVIVGVVTVIVVLSVKK